MGKRRGHPIQRRAGERGRHFAACEVANRSIDFLAHLPRHPFSFTLSPAASNVCLLKEKQREAKRGGRRNKKRMHRSEHGGSQPSEPLQDSSDFTEPIYVTMAYSRDNGISLISSKQIIFKGWTIPVHCSEIKVTRFSAMTSEHE